MFEEWQKMFENVRNKVLNDKKCLKMFENVWRMTKNWTEGLKCPIDGQVQKLSLKIGV